MKRIYSLFGKEFHIPKFKGIGNIIQSFSLTEKVIFSIFSILFIGTSLSMLLKVNQNFLIEIPRSGGVYKEGIVGTPRFINPLIALSETDRDMSALIYSGLMRQALDGSLIPDLAESVEISEDGLSYFFTIKENAVFHDGKPVTSDDVIFTILTAQDPVIKSIKRANWDSISIEKVNDKELIFHLQQQYAPFLYNTTLGILPKHIWQGVSAEEFSFSQFNSEPIGSGPYKVNKIIRNKSGISEKYELQSFDKFTLNEPYIKNLEIKFYLNEEAIILGLTEKEIDAANSISPERVKEFESDARIEHTPLPRIFAIFFNQSKSPVLVNSTVRKALDHAIDRTNIIDTVLSGYGQSITGPIPPTLVPFEEISDGSIVDLENVDDASKKIEEARQMLSDDGWSQNEEGVLTKKTKDGSEILSFSISTVNVPELVHVAELVTETWRSLGADVSVKIFDSNDLNYNVIRPRKYDALLFGEVIGRDLDFYAFWHSSQRSDPGLNVADYANISVDRALEKARSLYDSTEKNDALQIFEKEIIKDVPAVFIYSPEFIYIVPKNLKGVIPKNITTPSDRFSNIYQWYIETDTVWKVFSKN